MAEAPARTGGLAAAMLGGALVLCLLVVLDLTGPLDHAVRDLVWPEQRWGPLQVRADTTANVLAPRILVQVSLGVALVVSVARRSAAPLLFVAATTAVASLVVLSTKWGMDELEVLSDAQRDLGAFPSGHMVAAIVFSGQLVLLIRPSSTSRLVWLPTVVLATVMACVIQIAALHYVSDVLGGALVGTGVLACASRTRLRQMAMGPAQPLVSSRKERSRGTTRSAS